MSEQRQRGTWHHAGGETPWPQSLTNEVVAEWESGLSARQIANLHGMSRNAVIGKLHRLKLPKRIKDIKPLSLIKVTKVRIRPNRDRSKELAREKERRRIAREQREKDRAQVIPITAKQDELNPGVTILELTWVGGHPGNCRAPLRLGADGTMLYCGDPVEEGESFCKGHCARFFNHQPLREIKAWR